MILVFRKTDDFIVNQEMISSFFSKETFDTTKMYEEIVSQLGGVKSDYSEVWIEDEEDINKTFTHDFTIQNGKVVFGTEKPIPEPEPQPPSEIELLQQENLTLQLALAETIEKQETDKINNQIALAELVETLIIQGVL